jgi:tetratricopeptide (TPR) repeat protein
MTTRRWLLIPIALLCLASAPIASPQEAAPTADTLVRHVRRALGRGQLDRARTVATATAGPAEVKAVSLALIELYEGKDAQARTRLTPLVEAGDMSDALLELGLLDLRTGKRDEGRARLSKLMQQSYDMTPESTFRMARAAQAIGDYRLANTIFQRIGQLPLQQAEFESSWGDMFFERHQLADALRSYRASLEADPTWIPALVGLARTIPGLADVNPAEAAAALKTAQTLAPAHPAVLMLTVEEQLAEEDKTAAAEALDRLAAARPGSREEFAFRAALAYAEGRTTTG